MPRAITTYDQMPGGTIHVKHLTPEEVPNHAQSMMGVIVTGYYRQFEGQQPEYPLPLGALVSDRYNPGDPTHVGRYAERLTEHVARGSRYGVIRRRQYPELAAFVEVSPDDANNRINVHTIITAADLWGENLGSTALHATLSDQGFSPSSKVVLKGFDHSPRTNAFYKDITFVKGEPVPPEDLFTIGGIALPQHTYTAPSLAGVQMALERRVPELVYRQHIAI